MVNFAGRDDDGERVESCRSYLVAMSDIEPFTIYQISDLYSPTHDFLSAKVVEQRPFFLKPVVWRTSEELTTEPVVVSVYAKGEPIDAVPVDQCMLQKGESDFRLLVPENVEYEIRVFNTAGQIRSADKYLIIAN